ncbi:hypothetical protein ACFX1T_006749 [Malus domestica]
MPPRRESCCAFVPNFPDITQLKEAMTHAFQNAIRLPPPQRTPLKTMYNLKLDRFMGNEGHEGAEKWLDHIEKTFQAEMLRRFKLGTKRKWRTFASALPCTTYHEFSEILVWMEDSDNLPSNSEDDEDKNDNQKKDDRGKGISTQGPRPRRGGRFAGGPRFQRQRDFSGAGGSGAPLCHRCNFRHHGECRRSGGACYTCGQMRHRAAQCP